MLTFEALPQFYRGLATSLKAKTKHQLPGCNWQQLQFSDMAIKLWRYGDHRPDQASMVLVPSIINGPEIFDLVPQYSLCRLLAKSYNCYIIEWRQCLPSLSGLVEALVRAIHYLKVSTANALNLLGYCFGGTIALQGQKLLASFVNSQVLIAPPVDFNALPINHLLAQMPKATLNNYLDTLTAIPKGFVNHSLRQLYHAENWEKYVNRAELNANDDEWLLFNAIEAWQDSGCDLSARLVKELLHQKIVISKLSIPTRVIYGATDKLVPTAAVSPLLNTAGVQSLSMPCGHLNLVLKPGWLEKCQYTLQIRR